MLAKEKLMGKYKTKWRKHVRMGESKNKAAIGKWNGAEEKPAGE